MLDAWMHPLDEHVCARVNQPVLLVQYEKFQWVKNATQISTWMASEHAERTFITFR